MCIYHNNHNVFLNNFSFPDHFSSFFSFFFNLFSLIFLNFFTLMFIFLSHFAQILTTVSSSYSKDHSITVLSTLANTLDFSWEFISQIEFERKLNQISEDDCAKIEFLNCCNNGIESILSGLLDKLTALKSINFSFN